MSADYLKAILGALKSRGANLDLAPELNFGAPLRVTPVGGVVPTENLVTIDAAAPGAAGMLSSADYDALSDATALNASSTPVDVATGSGYATILTVPDADVLGADNRMRSIGFVLEHWETSAAYTEVIGPLTVVARAGKLIRNGDVESFGGSYVAEPSLGGVFPVSSRSWNLSYAASSDTWTLGLQRSGSVAAKACAKLYRQPLRVLT